VLFSVFRGEIKIPANRVDDSK